jgi:SNF2 family DNA or RNA helicase
MRRKIKDVLEDLPEKIEKNCAIEMDSSIAEYYEQKRKNIHSDYELGQDIKKSFMRLRMLCTHPAIVMANTQDLKSSSSKYRRLLQILKQIKEKDEKVLIFTSFTKMIDILVRELPKEFSSYCNFIDGRNSRESLDVISDFTNQKGFAVLALNPKAAGVGLNITAANNVIHYNPEWNPATEDQATARTLRPGQKKIVVVHKLFYSNTLEEAAMDKMEFERELSEAALDDSKTFEYKETNWRAKALSLTPIFNS